MAKTNNALVKHIQTLACVICGNSPSDACHIRSKGAGGPDQSFNLIPMCRKHHQAQHTMSWKRFIEKFPVVRHALTRRGWSIDGDKLYHPDLEKYLTNPQLNRLTRGKGK